VRLRDWWLRNSYSCHARPSYHSVRDEDEKQTAATRDKGGVEAPEQQGRRSILRTETLSYFRALCCFQERVWVPKVSPDSERHARRMQLTGVAYFSQANGGVCQVNFFHEASASVLYQEWKSGPRVLGQDGLVQRALTTRGNIANVISCTELPFLTSRFHLSAIQVLLFVALLHTITSRQANYLLHPRDLAAAPRTSRLSA
jgi:hypothetical protein